MAAQGTARLAEHRSRDDVGIGRNSGRPKRGGRQCGDNEYFSACWYELQLLLNSGNHRHRDKAPIDWVYFAGQMTQVHFDGLLGNSQLLCDIAVPVPRSDQGEDFLLAGRDPRLARKSRRSASGLHVV
jgi:hypothetical protein